MNAFTVLSPQHCCHFILPSFTVCQKSGHFPTPFILTVLCCRQCFPFYRQNTEVMRSYTFVLGISALLECLLGLHEALGSFPSTTYSRNGGAHLQSQHLGGRSKRIRNSRSFLGIERVQGQTGLHKTLLQKTNYFPNNILASASLVSLKF